MLLRILITIALVSLGFPAHGNETKTFQCGGGATYSVLLPAGVVVDGKRCSGSLIFDSSVKVIDNEAFRFSEVISVTFPNSLIRIGDDAFWGTRLTSVSIPDSVEYIGSRSFAFNRIISVTLGNSVKTIGINAFVGTDITTISIPASVTSIGGSAFQDTKLSSPRVQHLDGR